MQVQAKVILPTFWLDRSLAVRASLADEAEQFFPPRGRGLATARRPAAGHWQVGPTRTSYPTCHHLTDESPLPAVSPRRLHLRERLARALSPPRYNTRLPFPPHHSSPFSLSPLPRFPLCARLRGWLGRYGWPGRSLAWGGRGGGGGGTGTGRRRRARARPPGGHGPRDRREVMDTKLVGGSCADPLLVWCRNFWLLNCFGLRLGGALWIQVIIFCMVYSLMGSVALSEFSVLWILFSEVSL